MDVIDGGTGTELLGTLPNGAFFGSFLQAQLNADSTHWERYLGWCGTL